LENYDEAEKSYKKCLELSVNYVAHGNLGWIYFSRKQYSVAANYFLNANKISNGK